MRTLILYVFHKLNENVDIFLKRGLLTDPNKQFIFIFNDKEADPKSEKWDFLHKYSNMHLYIRPNVGHDFQGWNEGLFLPASALKQKIIFHPEAVHKQALDKETDSISEDEYKPVHSLFDRFICLNSTTMGPYLPRYVTSDWVDCFTSKLSEEVKMTGISVNFISGCHDNYMASVVQKNYGFSPKDHVHVQSMIFGLDREGLDILLRYRLFHKGKKFDSVENKWYLICAAEVAMSSILRHEKKSIYSYMMNQGLVKYDDVRPIPDVWCMHDMYPLCETMFIKINGMNTFPEKTKYDASLLLP